MNLRKALVTAIAADSVVTAHQAGVHYLVAPSGASTPYVVLQKIGGHADYVFSESHPEQLSGLWQLRVTAEATASESGPDIVEKIKESLRATLNDASLTIENATVDYIRFEAEIPDTVKVTDRGNLYSGGDTYRIEVSPA